MNTKQAYKEALKMAWPSVLESFFIAMTGIIDTIMVGTLGEYAIAAVGLTTQPKFIGMAFFFAINISLSALVARRRGEQDKWGANKIFVTAMISTIAICIAVSLLAVFLADPLMSLVGSNSVTHEAAVTYFRIVMGGMIFNAIAMCINAAQRGSGNTRLAFITNLVSSIVNIIFNYLLIGGNFGFPAWGVKGAAVATVIGTVFAMVISILSLYHRDSLIELKYIVAGRIHFAWESVKSIFNLASNLFLENIMMRVGFMATALVAANLGTESFAIHIAGMNLLSLGFSFGDGMQIAAVALTGRALGEKDKKTAIKLGRVCQKIGFIMSVLLSLVLIVFGKPIMHMYFSDATMIEDAQIVIRFITAIVILQISQIIYSGCLRSGGDVRYSLLVGIIAVTFIRTLVTLLLVNVFDLGLIGVWIGVMSDQLTRFILLHHRFHSLKWVDMKI